MWISTFLSPIITQLTEHHQETNLDDINFIKNVKISDCFTVEHRVLNPISNTIATHYITTTGIHKVNNEKYSDESSKNISEDSPNVTKIQNAIQAENLEENKMVKLNFNKLKKEKAKSTQNIAKEVQTEISLDTNKSFASIIAHLEILTDELCDFKNSTNSQTVGNKLSLDNCLSIFDKSSDLIQTIENKANSDNNNLSNKNYDIDTDENKPAAIDNSTDLPLTVRECSKKLQNKEVFPLLERKITKVDLTGNREQSLLTGDLHSNSMQTGCFIETVQVVNGITNESKNKENKSKKVSFSDALSISKQNNNNNKNFNKCSTQNDLQNVQSSYITTSDENLFRVQNSVHSDLIKLLTTDTIKNKTESCSNRRDNNTLAEKSFNQDENKSTLLPVTEKNEFSSNLENNKDVCSNINSEEQKNAKKLKSFFVKFLPSKNVYSSSVKNKRGEINDTNNINRDLLSNEKIKDKNMKIEKVEVSKLQNENSDDYFSSEVGKNPIEVKAVSQKITDIKNVQETRYLNKNKDIFNDEIKSLDPFFLNSVPVDMFRLPEAEKYADIQNSAENVNSKSSLYEDKFEEYPESYRISNSFIPPHSYQTKVINFNSSNRSNEIIDKNSSNIISNTPDDLFKKHTKNTISNILLNFEKVLEPIKGEIENLKINVTDLKQSIKKYTNRDIEHKISTKQPVLYEQNLIFKIEDPDYPFLSIKTKFSNESDEISVSETETTRLKSTNSNLVKKFYGNISKNYKQKPPNHRRKINKNISMDIVDSFELYTIKNRKYPNSFVNNPKEHYVKKSNGTNPPVNLPHGQKMMSEEELQIT